MDPQGDRPVSGSSEQEETGEATASSPGEASHGVIFWICLVLGWGAIAIGLFGVLDHSSSANPFKVLRLLIGLNIVNDAVVIPVLLLVSLLARKWAPRWLLVPAQVWLIVAGIVSLYAYPLVRSFGKSKVNSSQLPFNYAHNLLIVLGVVTLCCAVLALFSWRRSRVTQG
jgi:hypothetical protein